MTESKILSYLTTHYQNHGYAPTVRNIMAALDFKSPRAVSYHLENLLKKGAVVKQDGVGTYFPAGAINTKE